MRRVALSLLVVLGLAAAPAAVGNQDVNGKWRGTAGTGTEIVLDLKADADNVTGTVSLNGAEAQPISEGELRDGRLSFTMPSMFGNGTVSVTGSLEGDDLVLILESERGKTTARLKRQSE